MTKSACALVAILLAALLALPAGALGDRGRGDRRDKGEGARILLVKTSPPKQRKVERGVVQSAGGTSIVLRELDGSVVTVAVVPQTQIIVNRQPAGLTSIQPGFVAEVVHFGSGPAVSIVAIGVAKPTRDRGVVQSVGSSSLVLSTSSGPVTINVGPGTTVSLNGRPAALGELRAGDLAEAAHVGASPAIEIRAVGRRGR
jgi:hypothetical protein